MAVPVLKSRAELVAAVDTSRRSGASVGFVATMGALHAGHLRLIEQARSDHGLVVVSVFVNPTQFSDAVDFERYPRDLDRDVAAATGAGADLVFAPEQSVLYPEPDPEVTVDPGPFGELLEGSSRPGHFRGVATVVAKLLTVVAPDAAYFGEKDYQQLMVIRRLVSALLLPVEIVACATVREPDGLALSSRNVRLGDEERRAATVLHRALVAGAAALRKGANPASAAQVMADLVASEALVTLDYAVVRDAATLAAPASAPLRLLIAARVGPVRLIDNLAAETGDPPGML